MPMADPRHRHPFPVHTHHVATALLHQFLFSAHPAREQGAARDSDWISSEENIDDMIAVQRVIQEDCQRSRRRRRDDNPRIVILRSAVPRQAERMQAKPSPNLCVAGICATDPR